jgi:hypothetical protein
MKTKVTKQKKAESPRLHKSDNPVGQNADKKYIVPGNPEQQKQVDAIENSPALPMQQKKLDNLFSTTVQREKPEEEEKIQGKFTEQTTSQLQPLEEEELPGQGKFAEKPSQMEKPEEEELPGQGKFDTTLKQDNKTGMPDRVKSKMENSFNSDFSDVKVHANSSKAPEVGALAYTQGQDVHFAPGQFSPDTSSGQKLLGHELAHVVQQREGRVQPTTEVAGMPVNDNPDLENEADRLGDKAGK